MSELKWEHSTSEGFLSTWDSHASVYQGREWHAMFRAYGYKSWPMLCKAGSETVAYALVYAPTPYAYRGREGLRAKLNQALFPELAVINGPRVLNSSLQIEVHQSFAALLNEPPFSSLFRQRILARQLPVDHPAQGPIRAAFSDAGFTARTAFTFLLDLQRNPEKLWSGVHPKKRNRVNRARRDGIEVREALGLDGMRDYYAIRQQTWKRTRLPEVPFAHFETTLATLQESGAFKVYISSLDGVDLAGQMCFLSANWVQLNGVAVADANIQGRHPGNELLQWHVIEEMAKAGLKKLDYGGATPNTQDPKKKGIHAFKASWGGDLVEHYQFERQMPGWRSALFNLISGAKASGDEAGQSVL